MFDTRTIRVPSVAQPNNQLACTKRIFYRRHKKSKKLECGLKEPNQNISEISFFDQLLQLGKLSAWNTRLKEDLLQVSNDLDKMNGEILSLIDDESAKASFFCLFGIGFQGFRRFEWF